jgi:FAD synthetase
METVMVFGTFDIFHKGHGYFLRQAKKHGDYLIVVIARDATVKKNKGEDPISDEYERVTGVRKSGLADRVLLGNIGDKYALIKEYKPNVICLGYDQKFFVDKLQEKLTEFGLEKTEIIRLKSYKPEIYKSSILKENITQTGLFE